MGVSLCLGSRWFLLWVGTPCGVSSLCHDDLVMGSLSEWGLFFDIRSLVMIFRGGVRVLVTMFTVFEDVLTLMLDFLCWTWSCRVLYLGDQGWVIRWVLCDCVC